MRAESGPNSDMVRLVYNHVIVLALLAVITLSLTTVRKLTSSIKTIKTPTIGITKTTTIVGRSSLIS